jgi:hypothetical protein
MAVWLAIIGIIVVCVAVLLFRRHRIEGFGQFLDDQKAFADRQDIYFHDKAEKGILTNPGLILAGLNEAVAQPDYDLPNNQFKDMTRFFMEDPENAWTEQDNALCRGAKHPRDLPARAQKDRVSCGWYFFEDPDKKSVGAIGSRVGPALPGSLPPGGTWIWNRAEASRREDIKLCKAVKSCEFIDLDNIRGKCAFCVEKGHGVPISGNGDLRYPDDPEASCGTSLIKRGGDCAVPADEEVLAGNGRSCGTAGRPSSDGSKRIYTAAECTGLGGQHLEGGLCVRPDDGGSFSVECAGLNTPLTSKTGCPITGPLDRACATQIANLNGFGSTGGIVTMINGVQPSNMTNDAIRALQAAGVETPFADILGNKVDANTLNRLLQNIATVAARRDKSDAAKAAAFMINGTPFNPCSSYKPDQTGPFNIDCLQRAFRRVGCQAGGAKYPNERSAVSEFASMTWSDANAMFKKTFDDMKSADPKTQDMALKNCLGSGTEFHRNKGQTCWKCENGIHAPIRRNAGGEVECASLDGYNCLMQANKADCDLTISRLPTNIKPRVCKEDEYNNSNHWCARASASGKYDAPLEKV